MSHCGKCCEHTPEDNGLRYSLYEKIDMGQLECLNEATDDTGRSVFRPWSERLDVERYVESDADQELLFNVPFTANVKLKGVVLLGDDADSHPRTLRIYKNRPAMTFDDTKLTPDQEFHLQKDSTGSVEYPTKVVTFSSVTHLTLHFSANFGGDVTKIYYIGLRGEFSPIHRHGVTICSYETKPNVADHKTDAFNTVNQQIQ